MTKTSKQSIYTGYKPSDRARKAGYYFDGVHENISTGEYRHQDGFKNTLALHEQTDALMTAITTVFLCLIKILTKRE